jgi:hypothetical protein
MRHSEHIPVFTVFGGAYVGEHHGTHGLFTRESGQRSAAKAAAVGGLLILGVSTAAAATKATSLAEGIWARYSHSAWIGGRRGPCLLRLLGGRLIRSRLNKSQSFHEPAPRKARPINSAAAKKLI